jgi:thiosulfate/3-mercaptopyruvate sulfurtransferase
MLICATQIVAADKGDNKPDASILVEPEQLQKKLSDKNLRVLDVRSQDEYVKAHIPGAVRVDVGDWKSLAVAENGLHDTKGWTEKVGSLGITSGTHVVVYGSKVSDTARIWWLLKYVGVENASLLNGGWEWWTKKDRPVKNSTPQLSATKFKPEFQVDRLAEIDSVKKSLKSERVKVVDTRSDSEFAGGRIPDSVHLEWKHLLAEDGRFKTPTQLKEIFRKQGILPSETAVCY